MSRLSGGVVREWAEDIFVPSRRSEKRDTRPYRYLTIRVRRQQGELFADGAAIRHFAVVSNIGIWMVRPCYIGIEARPAPLSMSIITWSRFAIFTHIGQVVRHGGRLLMRIGRQILEGIIGPGRIRVLALAWDSG